MKNFTLGRYIPLDSIIHKLDPRNKIISMLILMFVIVLVPQTFVNYVILAAFVLFAITLSKLKLSFLAKALKPMMFMLIFLFILNVIIRKDGDILFYIGSFAVYSGGVIQTAYIIARLVLMIIITTILTATTKPLDLTTALEDLFKPYKRFGFPAHEIAMMISIALRFIPTLFEEAERIMKAQASRGVDFVDGKLMEKIKAIVSLLVPLFVSSFQRAEDLANAMESRGYNPSAKRTRYRMLSWKTADTLTILIILTLTISLGLISYAL